MQDIESNIKKIIVKFSSLIKYVILKNLHKTDRVDLDDIEQEVQIKIWRFLEKGKKVENLPSYIKRVAYTATVDELRKMRKQIPSENIDHLKNIYSFSKSNNIDEDMKLPEFILEEKELKSSLRELIESLGENRKQVLRLYLTGLTVEEISEFFDWDKTKVRHLLYRGINDIKEKIKNEKKLP